MVIKGHERSVKVKIKPSTIELLFRSDFMKVRLDDFPWFQVSFPANAEHFTLLRFLFALQDQFEQWNLGSNQ